MLTMNFNSLCSEASVPDTKRQMKKFEKGFGMAYNAKTLRLVEKKNKMIECESYAKSVKSELQTAIEERHIRSFKEVRNQIQKYREAKSALERSRTDYAYAKNMLPKYHKHVGV